MNDPDAAKDVQADEPPPQPPRPAPGTAGLSQMEQDELLARRLAEEYENAGTYEDRTSNRDYRPQRRAQTGLRPDQLHDEREHSFLDDDLPVIRENLRKGFLETQTVVTSWITSIKKKVDEAFDEDEETRQSNLAYGRKPGEPSRRSGDYDRYDADPHVITDDFAGMKLGSDGGMCRSSITRGPSATATLTVMASSNAGQSPIGQSKPVQAAPSIKIAQTRRSQGRLRRVA